MTAYIDTSRFYRSHLTSPRGRGGWLFEDYSGNIILSFNGYYAEAKKAAKKAARQAGLSGLYVCP